MSVLRGCPALAEGSAMCRGLKLQPKSGVSGMACQAWCWARAAGMRGAGRVCGLLQLFRRLIWHGVCRAACQVEHRAPHRFAWTALLHVHMHVADNA